MTKGALIRQTCKECEDMRCGNNPYRNPNTVPAKSIRACVYYGKLGKILKVKGEN